MGEKLAVLDTVNIGPKQRVTHAHIRGDIIKLHWHNPESEPEKEKGVGLSKEDWLKMMNSVYWKREETIEAEASEGTNLISVDVRVGFVNLKFRKGRKAAEEEVSVQSLQQVDALMRRRHR